MSNRKIKNIIGNGIALAVPLAIVVYVFAKVVEVFKKWITPVCSKLGIDSILGELTLTIMTFIIIAIIVLLLGLLMQFGFVSNIRNQVEQIMLRFIPSLNMFNVMLSDKLNMENATTSWKPVILNYSNTYNFAFKIEESAEMGVFFIIKGTSIHEGETTILKKKDYCYAIVDANDLKKCLSHFGLGSITLIQKAFNSYC